jgi:hypothetical protein
MWSCRLSGVYFVVGSVQNPADLLRANAEEAGLAVVIPPCESRATAESGGGALIVNATRTDMQVTSGGQ